MGYTKQSAVDASGIFHLFEVAISHKLKHPHVRLQTTSGKQVALKLAGPNSKNHGCVYVTDGREFGANTYFGRIDRTGKFLSTNDAYPELFELLAKFSANPPEVAAEYGKLTGNCCFCGLQLSDVRSTAMGYGPVCADHFGLPWGTDKQPIKTAPQPVEPTVHIDFVNVAARIASSIPTPEELLADKSTPFWAQAIIEHTLQLDAVDVANTFSVLAQAFEHRATQLLGGIRQ